MDKFNVLGEAPVGRLLAQYAFPAIVAMAASSVYNIIDGIFIGQGVGAEAIMGLALTAPVMSLTAAFGAIGHTHAGNLNRILKREEESFVGAVLRFHIQEFLAIKYGLTLGDGIERVAGEDGAECRLARTVRAHNGMYLTVLNREVDALQYFFACDRGM